MTTYLSSSAPARPPAAAGLRAVLRKPGDAAAYVDGGWWPYSLDLVAELPPLISAVEAAGYGEIRRISYALTGWNGVPPRRAAMLDRIVRIGGFRYQDPAEIALIDSGGWRRVVVVVVPPSATPAVARRALALAGANGDRHHAREILDLSAGAERTHSVGSACVDEFAAASWTPKAGGSCTGPARAGSR